IRPDWRDALRERAFRRGLVLLEAGERVLRFYPRYDTEPSALDAALSILRQSLDDLIERPAEAPVSQAPEIRVAPLALPLDTLAVEELATATFDAWKTQLVAVEHERYGSGDVSPAQNGGVHPSLEIPL